MAILTTNISSVSLTVSGNTTQSTNISWTCPTVPSGNTITSCTLTGTATASMSKGSVTITVNGTTVTSGSNFTINLGTANTTSSVTATVKGGNKNASGTVTFSNLVYTVNYSEPVQTYTVTFVDYDGTVLKTQTVNSGASATAPTNPTRSGYIFTGWDKSFTNVTSNLTVTAQYEKLYTVTFVDYNGTVLKTEEVRSGGSATAPSDPSREGYTFTGWDTDFSNVASNITVTAQYTKNVVPNVLKIKENGGWTTNIGKIYKKINGVWTEQPNDSWVDLFDSNVRYMRAKIPTAVLYSDGTLVFSNDDSVDNTHGSVINSYTGWDTERYLSIAKVPWADQRANIKGVYAKNIVTFRSLRALFYDCQALESLDVSNFDTSNVTHMNYMFYDCYSLASLDVSNFDTSNVTDMGSMFSGCSALTSLDLSSFDTSKVFKMSHMFADCQSLTLVDLSSFDTSNVTDIDIDNMFGGCTNPNLTIYVKDAATKTKIESSNNFPSTATVVIGSPN